MKYKMAVFDLDGTLLDKNQQITERTKDVIRMLKEMGCYIVINTGRSYNACVYYSKLINADYTICCNGGFTFDNNRKTFLNKLPLDKDITNRVLEFLFDRKDYLKIQWDSVKTYYSNNITPFETRYMESYKRDFPNADFKIKVIQDIAEIKHFNEEVYQIFFHPHNENTQAYYDSLNKLSEIKGINIVDFKKKYTDINDQAATKGNSLRQLASLLNIANNEVMVFGDGENDISMFEYAGLSIAMENATDDLKNIADITTYRNDREGVSRMLESIFKLKTSHIVQ